MIKLTIPFFEKDRAKELARNEGTPIRWDPDQKFWYFPGDTLPACLQEFADSPTAPTQKEKPPQRIERAAQPPPPPKPKGPQVLAVDYTYMPFAKAAGAKWNKDLKVCTYEGKTLPIELTGFEPLPYSWEAWAQEELTGDRIPPKPCKEKPLIPREDQETAIKEILKTKASGSPGFLLADEVGLGKTISAWESILQMDPKKEKRILILAPLGVLSAWRATIERMGDGKNRVLLLNYDKLKKIYELAEGAKAKTLKGVARKGKPLEFDVVVLDEAHKCFPYHTRIKTDHGHLPIGEIVEQNLNIQVLSKNLKTGKLEYKKITHRFKTHNKEPLTEITHEHGQLRCTSTHPMWIEEWEDYKSPQEILLHSMGYMPTLWTEIPKKKEGKENREVLQPLLFQHTQHGETRGKEASLKHTSQKKKNLSMFGMQDTDIIYPLPPKKVLQHELQCHSQEQEPESPTKPFPKNEGCMGNEGTPQKRGKMPEILQQDEEEQSHEEPRHSRENAEELARADISLQRREWKTDEAPITSSPSIWIPNGTRDSHRKQSTTIGKIPSEPLQSGPGHTTRQNCNRNRWRIPQNQTLEILRQEENENTQPSRLVSIEILEPTGNGEPLPNFSNNTEVYNLEIEENHNYFAEGILVSNCKNPTAARSKLAAGLYKEAGFLLWMSATAGQNLLELAYLAPLLAHRTGDRVTEIAKDFEAWCKKQGFALQRGEFGKWTLEESPETNKQVHDLLFKPQRGILGALRRRPQDIEGWPEIQRIAFPVELDHQGRELYNLAWEEFLQAIESGKTSPTGQKNLLASPQGMAGLIRLRQKASLLKVPETCELALELLDNGKQVAISCQYLDPAEKILEIMAKEKIPATRFTGLENPTQKEENRLLYQTEKARVIVFTVEEGISLHAGEKGNTPRIQIDHDPRWSAIAAHQIDGRSHRNGTFAPVYWMFLKETVEEHIITRLLERMASMKEIHGDEKDSLEILKRELFSK